MLDRIYSLYDFDASRLTGRSQSARRPVSSTGRTAIHYVDGALDRGGNYGTGYDQFRADLSSTTENDSINVNVVHISSPGGAVAGAADAGDAIASANKIKPTYAYIEDLGASAAYLLASQCRQICAGRSAIVGGIGTLTMLVDDSKHQESAGRKFHLISTGPLKGIGAPGQSITAEQLNEVRRVVDSMNAQFLSAVATGRRMSPQALESVATGQVWIASDAKALGLIDCIGTFDQFLAGINARHPAQDMRQTSRGYSVFEKEKSVGNQSSEFWGLVEQRIKAGQSRQKAISAVAREEPTLHAAMIAEANHN